MIGRLSFTLCLTVFLLNTLDAQVLINEIQSSNSVTISDEFNEYPDWIEVINNSASPINLQGWYLSDDVDSLDKWSFPSIQLAPSQPLLVFASGRDLKQAPAFLHTIIDLGNEWAYVVPSDTVSANWNTLSYSDNNWPTGNSGFGFGDLDDNTTLPTSGVSVYIRKKFTITDVNNIVSILLHVDYDDGFVAYLNGVEVARVNLGTAGTTVTYNQLASAGHEALIYQGLQPEMFNISSFVSNLVSGENILALEVHNNSVSSSDLSLIPFLTVGKTMLEGGESISTSLQLGNQFPHTNFKLKSGGEKIILSNPSLTVIDSITPPAIQPDVSYGRLSGNINQFRFFADPTPGSVNGLVGSNLLTNDKVNYSIPGGYHAAGFNVQLSCAGSLPIYYTTDGSEPTDTSALYTSQIYIAENSVLRSRIIAAGYLPGKVYASTYYTDRTHDLPVICLSTNPDNLWDYNTGMYVMGPNAESGEPYHGANFWMDWEKPFHIEYYNTNGTCLINQGAGASIFGAWSRAHDQKSFALFARKDYGLSSFNYPFFKKRNYTEYKSVVLRNAGNDWDRAFCRDGLITDITAHLGIEHQAFQPTVTYLNGEYWGIYNMREKVNEDFLTNFCNVKADEIIILQNNSEVVEGTNTDYVVLRDYINTNTSLADKDKYSFVNDRMDIDNFLKYQLVQIYVNNTDWPGNNNKYWKTTQANSKWRWILYDTDFGLGIWDDYDYQENTLSFAMEANGSSYANAPWATLFLRRLVTNQSVRNSFVNQMADNINTTFRRENVEYYIDSLKNIYFNEMPYHRERWGQDFNYWSTIMDKIPVWCNNRNPYMLDFVQSQFSLAGQINITLNVSNKQHGRIHLNTITPANYPFTGVYFTGVPVELEAIPAPGYKFVRWEGSVDSTQLKIAYNPTGNATFTAVFELATAEDIDIVINEINYNSSLEIPTKDWVELYNNGLATIDLSNYKLADANIDSGYVIPTGTILPPDNYLLILKDINDFEDVYPYIKNYKGEFDFGLSSTEDQIRLYNSVGTIMDAVDYLSVSPWPEAANGTGATLELINPGLDNGQPQNWTAEKIGGTPGSKNSSLVGIPETEFAVNANLSAFPNKFSDYITITFVMPTASKVNIDVVDMQGRIIANIADGYYPAGENYTEWIPEGSVSGGVYVVRMRCDSATQNINVIYLKP